MEDKQVIEGSLTDLVRRYEIDLISKALEAADGNCAEAARILKIKRSTLVEKRKRFNFSVAEPVSYKPVEDMRTE